MKTAFLILVLLGQDGWWNGDWGFRRKVSVANHLKEPLKAGFPVAISFNPGFLGLDKRCAPGYGDIRVVRDGKPVPCYVEPVKADKLVVGFRLIEEIKAKGQDTYFFYYGGKEAKAQPSDKSDIFEFVAEFNREEDLKKFDIDPKLNAALDGGKLVLAPNGPAESRLKLNKLAALGTFQFKMSFAAEARAAEMNAGDNQITVHLRPKLAQAVDPKVEAKVAELIEKLGEDEYRVREEATKAIVELGKAAVAKVEAVYKETKDAEVKWRCEFILQEIAKKNPIPGISVSYAFVPNGVKNGMMFTVTTAIGGKTSTSPMMAVPSIDLEITRMEKFGSVTIRTPAGQMASIGELKEEIEEIWVEFRNIHRTTVKIDSLSIERYLSDQGRPTFEIDIEESKK